MVCPITKQGAAFQGLGRVYKLDDSELEILLHMLCALKLLLAVMLRLLDLLRFCGSSFLLGYTVQPCKKFLNP